MKQIIEPCCKSCIQETDCKGCLVYMEAMEAYHQSLEEESSEIQAQVERRWD